MCYDARVKVGEAVFAISECGGGVSIKQVAPTQGERVTGNWDRSKRKLDARVPDEVKTAVESNLATAGR